MDWIQKEFRLESKSRGFHLVTNEVLSALPDISAVQVGMFHLFIKHTSASLTINENADPTVRQDMESHFKKYVPEGEPYYKHNFEGDDDMPAHIKSSILGSSIVIPITAGRLNLGDWQGVYLCEHRNHGGSRTLVATIMGKTD